MQFFPHRSPRSPTLSKASLASNLCRKVLASSCLALATSCALALPQVGEAAIALSCRAGDEAYHALKLTKFSCGIRVDYVIVATGERTWANMNQELVRQFRVKEGTAFCMVRTKISTEWVDYD